MDKKIENFIWRILQTLSKQGLSFLAFYLASFYLSPEEFGIYTYIFVVIYFFVLISDFGISSAVTKYSAESKYKKDSTIHSLIPTLSYFLLCVSSCLVIFILIFGAYIFGIKEYKYILLLSPLLFFIPFTSILDGIYRGVQEFKKLSIINILVGGFFIGIFVLSIQNFGIIGAFLSQVIYYVVLSFSLYISKTWKNNGSFDKRLLQEILKYSIYIGIATVGYSLYTKADILILKQFGYVAQIGHYEIIIKLFDIIILPFIILGQVVGPTISPYYVEKKYMKIKRKYIYELFFLFLLGILLSLGVFLIFSSLLPIFFAQYNQKILLYILSVFILFLPIRIYSAYVTQGFIVPSGNFKPITFIILIFGILNIITNILLYPLWGINVIFISTAVYMSSYLVLKDIFFIYSLTKQSNEN